MGTTKIINVFDKTPRKIRCVKNTYDLLGDGTLITEANLEVGKIYTAYDFQMHSYGAMVFIHELYEDYGLERELFEEMEEYDAEIVQKSYQDWLYRALSESEESLKRGEGIPAEQVFRELRKKYDLAETDD